MIGKTTQVYEQASKCTQFLLGGVVIAVDPSIGSTSSMPGYAVYRAGQLVESGILSVHPGNSVPHRLNQVSVKLRQLYNEYIPDVLVYEDIPAQRHGGSAVSHASLLKAVGAVLSVAGPEYYVGIFPVTWKRLVSPGYVKSDEQDAIELGRIVIELAKRIEEERKQDAENKANKKSRNSNR